MIFQKYQFLDMQLISIKKIDFVKSETTIPKLEKKILILCHVKTDEMNTVANNV